jgi:putative solute:sodium symporter small subunit
MLPLFFDADTLSVSVKGGGRPDSKSDVSRVENLQASYGGPRARLIRGGYATMPTEQEREEAHWRRTTNLMLIHLGIWFFFGYVIHMFVNVLNKVTIPIVEFPLGFYMAAQGALIVFVVQLFLFAKQQNKIDREFGYAEEEE